jgi:hypothetical protein
MFDLQSLIKYLLEGLAVAVAAYFIPKKTVDVKEIALIALTAAAVFAVLDQFAPGVAAGARQGAGFGIGFNQVGMPGFGGGLMGLEGFDDQPIEGLADLEGYDDYEGFYAEEEEDATPEEEHGGPAVCQMNGDQCTYSQDATAAQQAQYLCSKGGEDCGPVEACAMNDQGQCDWANDSVKDLADAAGRMCQTEEVDGKQVCRLSPLGGQQGFSSDNIEGFSGFPKTF